MIFKCYFYFYLHQTDIYVCKIKEYYSIHQIFQGKKYYNIQFIHEIGRKYRKYNYKKHNYHIYTHMRSHRQLQYQCILRALTLYRS